jgi:aryl-alcohol dehydrogenase-like predicted oxidoreductase
MTKLFYPVLEDTPNARSQPAYNDGALANQMGLSRKHIFDAVGASLRRLAIRYIDVLQLHRLDHETSPEEIMSALHDLVRASKVHYLGASSMYTWQFARLQYTAKVRGWTPFISMSGLYNLLYRERERKINPFCNAKGIGLVPWSPIARGLLTGSFAQQTERGQQDKKTKKWFQGRQNEEVVHRVETLAAKKGCSMPSLVIAWLLQRNACPIVGLNLVARIEAASEALAVDLTAEEMHYLERIYIPLQLQAI